MENHDNAYYTKIEEDFDKETRRIDLLADHYAAEQREKINKINSIEIAFGTNLIESNYEPQDLGF
jgi:hypothetical protein